MIAYVFWHTPRSSIDGSDYEQGLEAFHSALAGRPSGGYCSSLSLRVGRLPWMGDATSYEDWYLVDDFTALGELNDRAAADHHATTHDRVAGERNSRVGSADHVLVESTGGYEDVRVPREDALVG